MTTKRCGMCKTERSLSEFAKHTRDGHQSRCRACKREEGRARYRADPERARERSRNRPAEAKRATAARYRERHGDRVRAQTHEYFHRQSADWHRRRYLLEQARTGFAGAYTRAAVRDGRLTRGPCEVCGAPRAQGHHDDYRQHLTVRWLCVKHHAAWHSKNEPVYLPGWEARFTRLLERAGLPITPADEGTRTSSLRTQMPAGT